MACNIVWTTASQAITTAKSEVNPGSLEVALSYDLKAEI